MFIEIDLARSAGPARTPRSSFSENLPTIAQVNYSEYDRLSEVAKAVRYYEKRHTRGKVVITVEHNNKPKPQSAEPLDSVGDQPFESGVPDT